MRHLWNWHTFSHMKNKNTLCRHWQLIHGFFAELTKSCLCSCKSSHSTTTIVHHISIKINYLCCWKIGQLPRCLWKRLGCWQEGLSARAVAPRLEQTLLEEWMKVAEDLLGVDFVVTWMQGTGCVPHQHVEHVLQVILKCSMVYL